MSNIQTIELLNTETGNKITVKLDPDFQMRIKEDPKAIADYKEALLEGAIKEPLEAVEYTKNPVAPTYRLVSGFHRAKAYLSLPEGHSVKPMEVKVVANSANFDDLKQAAAIYGAKSNLIHGVRFTDDDRKKTAIYLVKNTNLSPKEIAETIMKPKRTVDRWVKEPMNEKRKLSLCAIWRNAQMNPNISIDSLMASDNKFLSRELVSLCRDLHKYYGDIAVQQWLDIGFPVRHRGESIEAFYNRELAPKTPKGSQEESTEDSRDTSSNPSTERSESNENKQPNEVKTNQTGVGFGVEEPEGSREETTEDTKGVLVDYDALAYRYINLELTTEDIEIMLDPDIAEQVRKIARKQVERSTHNLRQRVKELEHETSNQHTQIAQLKAALSEVQDHQAVLEEYKDKPVEFPEAVVEANSPVDVHDIVKQCRALRATQNSNPFLEDVYNDTVMKYHQDNNIAVTAYYLLEDLKVAIKKPDANKADIRAQAYAIKDLRDVLGGK